MQAVPEHSRIILDNLPEAYIRFDSEFRCTFVNQAAQILLGNNRVKLLGNRLWDVYPENAGTPIEEGFRRAMAERTVFTFDLYEKSRNRRYSITAMHDSSGGIILRFSDITERLQLESQLRQAQKL
jgi:PAS domain S-box-containing protein